MIRGHARPSAPARRLRAAGRGAAGVRDRRGFTVIEAILSLTLGLVILMGATGVALVTLRAMRDAELREGMSRQGRFVGLALERDLAFTGVELTSDAGFGSLAVRNDTLVILSVPVDTAPAPLYSIYTSPGTPRPMPPGGNCAPFCVEFIRPPGGRVELASDDLAVLAVATARRLVVVDRAVQRSGRASVTFRDLGRDELLLHPANFSGGLLLDPTMTTIQRVAATIWWRDGDRLLRAERVAGSGEPRAQVVATGVRGFDVRLLFADGSEADAADPLDANPANDYDQIAGVRVALRVAARGVPVGRDSLPDRTYEWRFTPRNLIYERNRKGI